MQLTFTLQPATAAQPSQAITLDLEQGLVAGWAGRDAEAVEAHIVELEALGVPRPSSVPLYYRIGVNQFIQSPAIQVVGEHTSGEAEVLVFTHNNEQLVSLSSDHTDRKLEAHSVALSKQICPKPVALDAWRLADVAGHWDDLVLRSWITENGDKVLYQEGTLASLRSPRELIQGYYQQDQIPAGHAMTCGTVNAIGGIRPAPKFMMELHDPHLNRSLRHEYAIHVLPEIN